MVAGPEGVSCGCIVIRGGDATHRAPGQRDPAVVVQHSALRRHPSVHDNLVFVLRGVGTSAAEVQQRGKPIYDGASKLVAHFAFDRCLAMPCNLGADARQQSAVHNGC